MSISMSIKLLRKFLLLGKFVFGNLDRQRHSPIFSTSQGNVKVSPTTALYVCPCEINLGCDVDDVVASDLLPKNRKKRRRESEHREGNLNLSHR
jgi:hypothetical protein